MTNLPTGKIQECIRFADIWQSEQATTELTALVDDIHKKEARIMELESKIVDIHRYYGKELGE